MSFGIGSMLGMMGGTPAVKAGTIIFEKLKAAKSMEAGDLGDIMKSALGQGLKSLLQNPMKQSGGKASQAAQNAENQIDRKTYPQTVNAIDALQAAIAGIMSQAADVVGLGKSPDSLLYTVAATNILDTVGKSAPAWSSATMLKPAVSDPEMNTVADEMNVLTPLLASGSITDAEASTRVHALNALLTDINLKAREARRVADTYATFLATVAALGGLLNGGTPEWQATVLKALQDDVREQVLAANREFLSVE